MDYCKNQGKNHGTMSKSFHIQGLGHSSEGKKTKQMAHFQSDGEIKLLRVQKERIKITLKFARLATIDKTFGYDDVHNRQNKINYD